MVGIAQLVRAPDCGSGGRGFESHYSPVVMFRASLNGPLAQLVEHQTFNLGVPGSSPGRFTLRYVFKSPYTFAIDRVFDIVLYFGI